MSDLTDPPLTISAGTQVVTRVPARDEAGAVNDLLVRVRLGER